MANTSTSNNMVEGPTESRSPEILHILKEIKCMMNQDIVTVKDIQYDLIQVEKQESWETLSEEEKIKLVVNNSEKRIRIWYETEGKDFYDYNCWKMRLLDRFVVTSVSMSEFFRIKQNEEERVNEFAKRVEQVGIELGVEPKLRYVMFVRGIERSKEDFKMFLAMKDFDVISRKLIEAVSEYEFLLGERHNKKNQPTYVGRKPVVNKKREYMFQDWDNRLSRAVKNKRLIINEIRQRYRIIKGDSSIQVSGKIIKPLFDTGSEENYITMSMVKELNLTVYKLSKPKQRFTCLGQSFWINLEVEFDFEYLGSEYKEKFGIFPYRKEKVLLIGRRCIDKMSENSNPKEVNKNEDRLEGKSLLEAFYEGSKKGVLTGYECTIDAKETDRVVQAATVIPKAMEAKVDKEVQRLLDIGYIAESKSSWCNKIRPVEKPNGEIRLTTNLILLNQRVPLDRYSLPRMEELIHSLRDMKYFSKLDLKDGFFQIPLKDSDKHKTAFRIKNRLYEWTRMPMGFKNSPAVFQRFMDRVLKEELGKSCLVYVDDILIFGKSEMEHDKAVQRIIRLLVKVGLKGNREKCEFKKTNIDFLGHEIHFNEIRPLIHKDVLSNEYKKPENIDELRRFLGMVTYYRKFIPNCSSECSPLLELLKKDVRYVWEAPQEKAYNKILAMLMNPKVLAQPDFKKDFILDTDASKTGIGAILSQRFTEGAKPISFASRSLTPAERNYSITEKEMLAGIWAMEHFEYYLYGKEFLLRSDHKALEAFNQKGYLESERIQRWMERIQKFNFKVEYIKGEDMGHVDALSRLYEGSINEVGKQELSEEERKNIIRVHQSLIHRGAKATLYQLKKESYDNINESLVREAIKDCMICKRYNYARKVGYKHITAFEIGEKVGFDIIGPYNSKYIITAVDYFSRKGYAQLLDSRDTDKVMKFLAKIIKDINVKLFIADGAKENVSKKLCGLLSNKGIEYHITSPHHHESNGRVERFNQTVIQGLSKLGQGGLLKSRLAKVIGVYNDTLHEGINMSPNEMMEEKNWNIIKRSEFESYIQKYGKRFKNYNWPKMEVGEKVLIKDEIHKQKGQPLFKDLGKVVNVNGLDTYMVKKETGKIIKRHVSHLRQVKDFREAECYNILNK